MSPRTGRPQSNNSKTERIFVRVTVGEKEEIKKLCIQNGCTISDLIRKGMDALKK